MTIRFGGKPRLKPKAKRAFAAVAAECSRLGLPAPKVIDDGSRHLWIEVEIDGQIRRSSMPRTPSQDIDRNKVCDLRKMIRSVREGQV